MNPSRFMDKQIMDLSNSENNNFNDIINHHPQEDHHHVGGGGNGAKTDEIFPNYDFQPIRRLSSSQPSNFDSSNVGGTSVWSSAESKTNSGIRNYGSIDPLEPAKAVVEKDRDAYDATLISNIDRTMKKHADNLIHALEGISARLSQLESRSSRLENTFDDLKASIGNNYGSTDGKLRQIENIIREVQTGVQVVKDKQEILEARLQLSKVETSKTKQKSETLIPGHMGLPPPQQPPQQAESAPLQSHHHLPPNISNAPHPHTPQNPAPTVHHPNQFAQNVTPVSLPYYPPSAQTPEPPPQHYQLTPPPPQAVAPPPPPQPQYQPPPPHYSQPPPMAQQHPSLSNEEPPHYLQPQNFPPSVHQPGGSPGGPQLYGTPTQLYEPPPLNRPGSGFPSQYGPSSGHNEPYPYGGGSPMKKSQQHSPPNMGPSGTSAYPQLPTARILPHAVPTSSGADGGSSNSENRVPIDDVVDKVTNMGFPRDQVRAMVRKLTENGQAVDLNVVLDKVMADGVESQGPRGWGFGR